MNYDVRIRELEAELAHVREMQAIHRDHLRSLEEGHDYTGTRLAAIETSLETLTANVTALTGTVNHMAANVDRLVSALLREHPNGSEKDKGAK
jgi:hypothetical protein